MDRRFPRLHVVTDTRPGRSPLDVVRAAVAAARDAGCTDRLAVQVRVEDFFTDRQAYELTVATLALCRPSGVLCLVNDRLQVALAAGADGCHVGADDLPVAMARQVLDAFAAGVAAAAATSPAPAGGDAGGGAGAREFRAGGAAARGFGTGGVAPSRYRWRPVLGATSREPGTARAAIVDGATYLGVGPAHGTTTKDRLPAPIGPAGVGAVARAVPGVPVIAIGGITVDSVGALLAAGAHGVAVVGALSAAADPARATTGLLAALGVTPVSA